MVNHRTSEEEMQGLADFELGQSHYCGERYSDAIAAFTRAIRASGSGVVAVEALFLRGNVWFSKGRLAQSIDDYNSALAISPNEYRVLNDRGIVYDSMGEYDKAIADYTAALEIKPDYALALNNRGFVYIEKAEWDKAIADFTAALEIEPNLTIAQKNLDRAQRREK